MRPEAQGVSNLDFTLLERAESVRHVDGVQPPFSLIRRDAATALIHWARGQSSTRAPKLSSGPGQGLGPSGIASRRAAASARARRSSARGA